MIHTGKFWHVNFWWAHVIPWTFPSFNVCACADIIFGHHMVGLVYSGKLTLTIYGQRSETSHPDDSRLLFKQVSFRMCLIQQKENYFR